MRLYVSNNQYRAWPSQRAIYESHALPHRQSARSEPELHSVLNLKRIGGVARRSKSQYRIGSRAEAGASINGIEVRDVCSIEEVEEIAAELGADLLVEPTLTRDPHIEGGETGTFERVTAQLTRTI